MFGDRGPHAIEPGDAARLHIGQCRFQALRLAKFVGCHSCEENLVLLLTENLLEPAHLCVDLVRGDRRPIHFCHFTGHATVGDVELVLCSQRGLNVHRCNGVEVAGVSFRRIRLRNLSCLAKCRCLRAPLRCELSVRNRLGLCRSRLPLRHVALGGRHRQLPFSRHPLGFGLLLVGHVLGHCNRPGDIDAELKAVGLGNHFGGRVERILERRRTHRDGCRLELKIATGRKLRADVPRVGHAFELCELSRSRGRRHRFRCGGGIDDK